MISQVSFFALIGKLLRSDEQTQFLLVGNAVVIAAAGATFAMFMTTSERGNGTLSLLLASPSRPVVVFAARGVYVMADGVFSACSGSSSSGPRSACTSRSRAFSLVDPADAPRRNLSPTASAPSSRE